MRRLLIPLAVALVALGGSQFSGAAVAAQTGVVASVNDGDTLTLMSGARVRLLQIDAPEIGSGECYSRAARTALLNLTPVGSRLMLESDPALDKVDRYGRILRYLKRGSMNVNLELVRRGAAAPYFYRGDRGRYANQLMTAASAAKAAQRGLWGTSPRTILDPDRVIETGTCGPRTYAATTTTTCAPCASLAVAARARELRSELFGWLRAALSARCGLRRHPSARNRAREGHWVRPASPRR